MNKNLYFFLFFLAFFLNSPKSVLADAANLRYTASFSECQATSIKLVLHWQDTCTGALSLCVCPTNVVYQAAVSGGAFSGTQNGTTFVATGHATPLGWTLGSPTDVTVSFVPSPALTNGVAVTGIGTWDGLGVSGCGLGPASGGGSGVAQCIIGNFIPGNSISYNGPTINFTQAVQTAYRILTPLGLALAAFMIIKSGYGIMTSEGEPNKVKEAKEDLTSAIIGAVFILLSVVILRVIISSILAG